MSRKNLSAVERNALTVVARGHKVPQGILVELEQAGLVTTRKEKTKLVPQGLTPLGKRALGEVSE
ncbi:hypothetical protein [Corynebacterium pyruviciproducens]|uniref:hypothetical protein n=1 Tax=Corynebacterium pyruviciproducens TaxID=598660 RepID=UPI0023F0B012|nr:hypothetical protein [Corynebacterium pyruviciproducens]